MAKPRVLALCLLVAACGPSKDEFAAVQRDSQQSLKKYQDESEKTVALEKKLGDVQQQNSALQQQLNEATANAAKLQQEKGALEAKSAQYQQLAGSLQQQIKSGE